MTRSEEFKLILIKGKFRLGVKQLPPFETPEWVPVVLALRDLIESADRLNKQWGNYEGYTSNVGVCGGGGSVVSECGVQRHPGRGRDYARGLV